MYDIYVYINTNIHNLAKEIFMYGRWVMLSCVKSQVGLFVVLGQISQANPLLNNASLH